MNFADYVQHRCWDDALALVSSPEFQLPDEYAKAPFHPDYALTPSDHTMSKLFYAALLSLKLGQPFTQIVFGYADSAKKHVIFSPNVPLPLAILSTRHLRAPAQLHQLSKIKAALMRHMAQFDLYTDPYYKHYLLRIHIEIYQLYLREMYISEAWNQLRIILQLDPENAWAKEQLKRLADFIGIDDSENPEAAQKKQEAAKAEQEKSITDNLLEQRAALEQKLQTCISDEPARDLLYQNMAVLSFAAG